MIIISIVNEKWKIILKFSYLFCYRTYYCYLHIYFYCILRLCMINQESYFIYSFRYLIIICHDSKRSYMSILDQTNLRLVKQTTHLIKVIT